jgi:hypothetical protein
MLDFTEVDTAFNTAKKSDIIEIPVVVTITRESECRIRDSPKTFNFFLLCLGQAHYSVQIPIFEDLTLFARQS